MEPEGIIHLLAKLRFGQDPSALERLRIELTAFNRRRKHGRRGTVSRSAINNWFDTGRPSRVQGVSFLFDYYKSIIEDHRPTSDQETTFRIEDFFKRTVGASDDERSLPEDVLSSLFRGNQELSRKALRDFPWSGDTTKRATFLMYRYSAASQRLVKGVLKCTWHDQSQLIRYKSFWKSPYPWGKSVRESTGAVLQFDDSYIFMGRHNGDKGSPEMLFLSSSALSSNEGVFAGAIMSSSDRTTVRVIELAMVPVELEANFDVRDIVDFVRAEELQKDLQRTAEVIKESGGSASPWLADASTEFAGFILKALEPKPENSAALPP